jgi:Cof subfamily protein (haloacid dehalogenase superfamily)
MNMAARKIKLLAVDVDGTILTFDRRISEVNAGAVAKAMEKGIDIVLVSGRPPFGMDHITRRLNMSGYQIAYNGALVLDRRTGEVLFHRRLPLDTAIQAVRLAREHGLYLSYYAGPHWYVERECDEMYLEQEGLNTQPVIVPDLLEAHLPAPEKVLILSLHNPDGLALFYQAAGAQLAGANIHYSSPYSVEIVEVGASKGMALAMLTDKLGLHRAQVMAIGDSYNDISMLEFAGLSVAVGNAPPEVQAAAGLVVAPCEDDGVAEAIEQLILRPAGAAPGGG